MTTELTLRELLAVEDEPALLDFRCHETSLPVWPQIRAVFLRMMMSDLLYGKPITGRSAISAPFVAAGITMARSVAHNTRWRIGARPHADILITADAVADRHVTGRWCNRLADHFALEPASRTLCLLDHFEWRWSFPRRHPNVILHAPIRAINAVRSRVLVRNRHVEAANRLVSLVSDRARRHLKWSPGAAREQQLVGMLARKWAGLPLQYRTYSQLMDRARPKVLMLLAGCYGPGSALIAAARARGVVTAEYQHGAVSAGHDAYNFAPTLLSSPALKQTLPEYFLGYGDWWNRQFNAPVIKTAIGCPHRDAELVRIQSNPSSADKSDLLLLSDGIDFDLYAALAQAVEPEATRIGLRVVLRPHPLERSAALARHGATMGRVRIDDRDDIYAALATTHLVVSEVSTGVFEAIGLADRVLIWDTKKARFSYPSHPFQTFATAAELQAALDDRSWGRIAPEQVESVWAPSWSSNYRRFMAAQGVS